MPSSGLLGTVHMWYIDILGEVGQLGVLILLPPISPVEPKQETRELETAKHLNAMCMARFICIVTAPLITGVYNSAENP